MDIKRFEEFEIDHTPVNEEADDNQNLSDDIEVYKKGIEKDEIEKLDTKEWQVKKIIDIIKDPKEIEELENQIQEAKGGTVLSTDISAKDVKRGDTLWLTAILAPKNKSVAYAPGTMGVLKVRVVDIFYGLSKLKNMIK